MKQIWLVNDDEGDAHYLREDIAEIFPKATIKTFESPFDAWKSRGSGSPWLIVIDISAVGSIVGGPHSCYGGICQLADTYPGAYIVINSAVSSYFAQDVLDLVKERCPDSVVKLVTWSGHERTEALKTLLLGLDTIGKV